MWADGSVLKPKNKNSGKIMLYTTEPENLQKVLQYLGDWNVNISQSKNKNWKDRYSYTTSNQELMEYLLSHNYGVNNIKSADSILSTIPENLKHYWFLGLIDGDGCWYFNEKNRLRQFQITSRIDQDWDFIEKLFKSLDIKYSIDRRIVNNESYANPKHRSNIRIFGKRDVRSLGEYVYQTYIFDKIGMLRKYEKWVECITDYKKGFLNKKRMFKD